MKSGFRDRRLRAFLLPELDRLRRPDGTAIRILDVGGSTSYWRSVEDELRALNCHVTLLNVAEEEAFAGGRNPELFSFAPGDARKIPFADGAFDVVHSNSVIEHVGSWQDMTSMAAEVRRLAPAYFVQVPYFWFPYETHYRAPLIHWLPVQIRVRLFLRFRLGDPRPHSTVAGAMRKAQYTNLLDELQMRDLFPDGRIVRERFFGLTKSLIALRRPA